MGQSESAPDTRVITSDTALDRKELPKKLNTDLKQINRGEKQIQSKPSVKVLSHLTPKTQSKINNQVPHYISEAEKMSDGASPPPSPTPSPQSSSHLGSQLKIKSPCESQSPKIPTVGPLKSIEHLRSPSKASVTQQSKSHPEETKLPPATISSSYPPSNSWIFKLQSDHGKSAAISSSSGNQMVISLESKTGVSGGEHLRKLSTRRNSRELFKEPSTPSPRPSDSSVDQIVANLGHLKQPCYQENVIFHPYDDVSYEDDGSDPPSKRETMPNDTPNGLANKIPIVGFGANIEVHEIPCDQDVPYMPRKDRQRRNVERRTHVQDTLKRLGGHLRDRRSGQVKFIPKQAPKAPHEDVDFM